MVVLLAYPSLVYVHISIDTLNQLNAFPDKKQVFENLVVGQNVYSLEIYERVAEAVLQIPNNRVRSILRNQFLFEFLNGKDFIDESGELV